MAAASLSEQAKFAVKEGLIHKIKQAVISVALTVSLENKSHDETLDRLRLSLATSVLRDPDRWARIMVYGIVTDERIKSNSADKDFTDVIADLWNPYAGVNPNLS